MCVLTIHFDFLKYWELGPILLPGEVINLLRSSRLLPSELVARECKNLEARLELFVHLNHFFIVLVSQSSLRCYVHAEYSSFTLAHH